jgi:polyisoprenoid-binding protein YceI
MSRVRGRFSDVEGTIVLGPSPTSCRVDATIAAASVDTGTPMRDEDLRSPSFFDAARFPELRFTSGEITEDAAGIRLAGELTIRDTTRETVFDVEFLGFDETGLQGEQRIGFLGRTTVHRSDFGVGQGRVDGGKVVVGDPVEVVLDVEAYLEP